ncbi:MAG: carbon-nitrogen hydrolase family protein [Verrucomicrobiota bacterium]
MKPHAYRVAASCFEPEAAPDLAPRRAALRAHLVTLLDTQRPDLVVLPEIVIATGMGPEQRWGAEPIKGPTVALIAELAVAFEANICVPIVEDDRGTLYNTAVYVNRTGRIAGAYRKQVLTSGELDWGIRPGAPDQPPVTLDGLCLGTAICFDENFPDQIWHWIEMGVDLLVFPAYTFAGELMRAWAINCGVPLVCAFPWESVIYDRDGSTLAKAGSLTTTVRFGHHPSWIVCRLNFRSRIYHLDGNQNRLGGLLSRYGAKLDIRLMERDGRFMLTACADDIDLDQFEREFELVPLQEFLRASRSKNERYRIRDSHPSSCPSSHI